MVKIKQFKNGILTVLFIFIVTSLAFAENQDEYDLPVNRIEQNNQKLTTNNSRLCPIGSSYNDDFWNPFVEMERIRQQMNSMFSSSFNRGVVAPKFSDLAEGQPFFQPSIDVRQENDQYIIEVDLPGLNKEDINLEVNNGLLTITGERNFENVEESKTDDGQSFYRKERSFGSFRRDIPLPEDIDNETIKAEYLNGVLKVILSRLPEDDQSRGKKILIK